MQSSSKKAYLDQSGTETRGSDGVVAAETASVRSYLAKELAEAVCHTGLATERWEEGENLTADELRERSDSVRCWVSLDHNGEGDKPEGVSAAI